MINEHDLLQRIIASAEVEAGDAVGPRLFEAQDTCRLIIRIIDRALAAQPKPEAAPELPDYVIDAADAIIVTLKGDGHFRIPHMAAIDLDRIAEACRILAARRRAGL